MKSDSVIMVILLLLYCNDAWRDCVSIRERHVSSHVGQVAKMHMDPMDGAIVLCGSEPSY